MKHYPGSCPEGQHCCLCAEDTLKQRLEAAEALLREAIGWAFKPSCTFTAEDSQALHAWCERAKRLAEPAGNPSELGGLP